MAALPWLGVLALLAGCNDPAIDRGRVLPVVLSQESVSVAMAWSAYGASYRDAIDQLGGIRALHAIRARIDSASTTRAHGVRAQLLADGLDPDRIEISGLPGNRVVFTRAIAAMADCREATQPILLGDVSQSLDAVSRCDQAAALASSIADPADLVRPVTPGPADGARAAGAVQRWEQDNVKQAPGVADTGSDTDGGGGGGSGGGSQFAAPAVGRAAATPAVTGNPLLSSMPLGGPAASNE